MNLATRVVAVGTKASEDAEEEGGLEEAVWRETALADYRRQGPQASITKQQQAERNRTGMYPAIIQLRGVFLTSQCCSADARVHKSMESVSRQPQAGGSDRRCSKEKLHKTEEKGRNACIERSSRTFRGQVAF
jgi:hypothetical protein